MHFGIVADSYAQEHRVVLAPYGVEELVSNGHQVTIERGAGLRAQFTDEDYAKCGAQVAYSREEAWIRPDVLLRIRPPSVDEVQLMHAGQTFGGFIELALAPPQTREAYIQRQISLMSFEEVVDDNGSMPLLAPLSIICGRMVPQIAAHYLETFQGGRGKLLMGAPGVAPCNVSIIGAGTLGETCGRIFQALGARVTMLDHNHARLLQAERTKAGYLTTLDAGAGNISRVVRGSDVLVLAIHSPGGVCDKVIRREHLLTMQPRSLIIDASITQGGAAETSRPTDVLNPTFTVDDITHYCVPRITSLVARTTSRAISVALTPYLLWFARHTITQAIEEHREFDTGLVCINGNLRRQYEFLGGNQ
jgi:alanine dehydrogenase